MDTAALLLSQRAVVPLTSYSQSKSRCALVRFDLTIQHPQYRPPSANTQPALAAVDQARPVSHQYPQTRQNHTLRTVPSGAYPQSSLPMTDIAAQIGAGKSSRGSRPGRTSCSKDPSMLAAQCLIFSPGFPGFYSTKVEFFACFSAIGPFQIQSSPLQTQLSPRIAFV